MSFPHEGIRYHAQVESDLNATVSIDGRQNIPVYDERRVLASPDDDLNASVPASICVHPENRDTQELTTTGNAFGPGKGGQNVAQPDLSSSSTGAECQYVMPESTENSTKELATTDNISGSGDGRQDAAQPYLSSGSTGIRCHYVMPENTENNTQVVNNVVEGCGQSNLVGAEPFIDSTVADVATFELPRRRILDEERPLVDVHFNKLLARATKRFNSDLIRAANFTDMEKQRLRAIDRVGTCRNIILLWKTKITHDLIVNDLVSLLRRAGGEEGTYIDLIRDIIRSPP